MRQPSGNLAPAAGPLSTSSRRILVTEATTGGVVGGSLTGILELFPYLDRTRYEPVLVLFESKPIIADVEKQGIRVHVLAPLPPLPPARGSWANRKLARINEFTRFVMPRARELTQVFRRENPSLVYCANGVTPSLPVIIAAARCGVPVVCHFKGFSHVAPEARFASRWIDTAIGMTDEIVDHVKSRGVRARRFLTVFDGIDVAPSQPGSGAGIRREFGIPADAPMVGIVGHIQDWKGQLLAVEAVARARKQVPDLRCLVVGGVHRRGAEYAAKLRERIAQSDLRDSVVLTGPRRDVLACMDAMDVVMHASDREPFGRVMIEAMAVGRPVIAPREGGPIVIVVDGETGLLVAPRDPDAFARAIVALMTDAPKRAAMGRAGRARVESAFAIRAPARAMEKVFDEVLSARGAVQDGAVA
jgi:glycosyltransferase involved in cell wall biosynthesis